VPVRPVLGAEVKFFGRHRRVRPVSQRERMMLEVARNFTDITNGATRKH
jgi:hypothetical protein